MSGRMILLLLALMGACSCGVLKESLIDYCDGIIREKYYIDSQKCRVQAALDYYQACVHEPLKSFSLETFYDSCMAGKGWIK